MATTGKRGGGRGGGGDGGGGRGVMGWGAAGVMGYRREEVLLGHNWWRGGGGGATCAGREGGGHLPACHMHAGCTSPMGDRAQGPQLVRPGMPRHAGSEGRGSGAGGLWGWPGRTGERIPLGAQHARAPARASMLEMPGPFTEQIEQGLPWRVARGSSNSGGPGIKGPEQLTVPRLPIWFRPTPRTALAAASCKAPAPTGRRWRSSRPPSLRARSAPSSCLTTRNRGGPSGTFSR